MKWIGRILQTRRALVAPIAIVLFASAAVAATSQLNLPGGNFDVVAVVTPGADGGSVVFTNPWEEEMDFSVAVDDRGDIFVDGVLIGSANGASVFRITAQFDKQPNGDFLVDVYVENDDSGALLCSSLNCAVASDVANVKAAGLVVHSLSAG